MNPSTDSPSALATPIEAWETAEILSHLVEKSLVVFDESTNRYRLLETVRRYVGERLADAGEGEEVSARHLENFFALAEESEPELTGPQQVAWLDRLEAEHDNLRSALQLSTLNPSASSGQASQHSTDSALRMCGAMWRFWHVRGYLDEGRTWCRLALASSLFGEMSAIRAKVLNGAGVLAHDQGDYASARSLHNHSLSIRRQLGDRPGIAQSLNNLGNVACALGNYAYGRSLYEETLSIHRELGDLSGVAYSLNNLGNVACELGDYAFAHTLHEESLSFRRKQTDQYGISNSLGNLGNVAYQQGDYASARSLYEEGLSIDRALGDPVGIAYSLNSLGNVANAQGDYVYARSVYREGLSMRRNLGDRRGIAVTLEALAALAAVQSEPALAARIWGAAESLREEIGSPIPPNERERYDQLVTAARDAIGDDAFAAAWAEGREMTLEQGVEYALG